MAEPQFEQVVRSQLDDINKELADLRSLIVGRPDVGWPGMVYRIDGAERQISALKEVQDSFIRDRRAETSARDRKDKIRVRVQVAVFGVFGSVIAGVLIQVIVVLSHLGHP